MTCHRGEPVPGTASRCRVSNKAVRELIRNIEAAGGEVRHGGSSNHYKVYLDGTYIGTLIGTPSSGRSQANDISRLRRGGLKIDSKGRAI